MWQPLEVQAMKSFAISQVLMIFLVLVSGDHNFLFERLMRCVQNPATNIQETIAGTHFCSVRSFKHCFQDDYTYKTPPLLQTGFCGFIDSNRITSPQGFTWRITTHQTVWLHFILFELYFDNFPCSLEYMSLGENKDVKHIYCGYRLPWYYYSQTSTISVDFVSDNILLEKYNFKIYFQNGKHIAYKKLKVTGGYNVTFKHLDFEHQKYDFIDIYILAERWRVISVQRDNNCSLILSKVYDGPGVKSSQLGVGQASTGFIVLLKIQQNIKEHYCLNGFFVQYRTYHVLENSHNMEQCINERELGAGIIELSWSPSEPFLRHNRRCIWQSGDVKRSGLTVKSFNFTGPDTLLDNEECLFGGLFIYLKSGKSYMNAWSSCKPYNQLRDIPIFTTQTQVLVTTIEFTQYSEIVRFEGIISAEKGLTFNVHEDNLSNGTYLIDIRKFPMNYTFFEPTLPWDIPQFPMWPVGIYEPTAYVQSLTDNTRSYELTFGSMRSISAVITFVSSKCNIPPLGCSCVSFSARFGHKITSYYIPEASQQEDFRTVDLLSSPFLSAVTSLSVNQSKCRPNTKSIWMLKLSFRYNINVIANKSMQVMLADDDVYNLIVNITKNKAKKPIWVLFHLHLDKSDFNHSKFLTELLVRGISCSDSIIKSLEVEFIKPGVAAVVYKTSRVGDSADAFGMLYLHLKGITCHPCNAIIRFAEVDIHYSCQLLIAARKFVQTQDLVRTSQTGIKQTNLTFIAQR